MWPTTLKVSSKYSFSVVSHGAYLCVSFCVSLCLYLFTLWGVWEWLGWVGVYVGEWHVSNSTNIISLINNFLDEYYHILQRRKVSIKVQWPIQACAASNRCQASYCHTYLYPTSLMHCLYLGRVAIHYSYCLKLLTCRKFLPITDCIHAHKIMHFWSWELLPEIHEICISILLPPYS